MSIRPYRDIVRRKSRRIMVGSVPVGGDAPITVQSMTNTLTADADGDHRADPPAARRPAPTSCASPARTRTRPRRCTTIVKAAKVPIVADIHFHYKRAIEAAEAGAACLRINPGNIGCAERVREVIQAASDHGCSMRIGVNAGSLENATCWRSTASPARRRWSRARSTTPASCRTTTSTSSRSA